MSRQANSIYAATEINYTGTFSYSIWHQNKSSHKPEGRLHNEEILSHRIILAVMTLIV